VNPELKSLGFLFLDFYFNKLKVRSKSE